MSIISKKTVRLLSGHDMPLVGSELTFDILIFLFTRKFYNAKKKFYNVRTIRGKYCYLYNSLVTQKYLTVEYFCIVLGIMI